MEDKNAFKLAMGEISSLESLKTVMESYQISFKKIIQVTMQNVYFTMIKHQA